MSRMPLTRTNLLLEVGKVRRLRKALRSRSNSEAVRRVIDERLAVETGLDALIFQRTILTAVVAAELYAGTHDHREKRALDELCQAYRALGHFSSPSTPAWVDTGILLRRARSVFGEIEFVQHFRDLLMVGEVVRAGATLVVENVRV